MYYFVSSIRHILFSTFVKNSPCNVGTEYFVRLIFNSFLCHKTEHTKEKKMLYTLPEEVLFDELFPYLHPFTIVMCRSVCKRWKSLIDERYSGCGVIKYKIRNASQPTLFVRDDSVIAVCPCFHIFADIHVHKVNSFCDGLTRPDMRGRKMMFLGNSNHILVKLKGRLFLSVYLEYKNKVVVHEITNLSDVVSSMKRICELNVPFKPKRRKSMVWAGDDIIFYGNTILNGESGIYFFNLMKSTTRPLFRLDCSNQARVEVESADSDLFVVGCMGEFGFRNHRIEIFSKNGEIRSTIPCSFFQKSRLLDFHRITFESSSFKRGCDVDVSERKENKKMDVVYNLTSEIHVPICETSSTTNLRSSQNKRVIAQPLPREEAVSVDVVYMFHRKKNGILSRKI